METIIARTIPQAIGRQLGQAAPADTNNAVLYSPAAGIVAEVTSIIVANVTTSAAKYRIFHDDDGTTYNAGTSLFYDVTLPGNTTDVLETAIFMADSDGNLAVRSDTASALTFTAYGKETQAAAR